MDVIEEATVFGHPNSIEQPVFESSNGISARRWYAKKIARGSLATASGAGRALWRGRRRQCIRVLTYHRFGERGRDPFCLSAKDFEAQMSWVARECLAVSLGDLQAFRTGTKVPPPNAVLVTVDDGFRSLHSVALPILQRFGIPAVAFVPVGHIGQRHGTAGVPEPHLTWDELCGLSRAGITVGSHAWTHRSLGRMPVDEAREEAQRSRATLEDRLGMPVVSFAYPFGTRADFTATTGMMLERCGYHCAFTSQHGPVRRGDDAFTLPRIKVEGGEPLWMFRLLVRGGLDAWRWIDRTLWRLQEAPR